MQYEQSNVYEPIYLQISEEVGDKLPELKDHIQ